MVEIIDKTLYEQSIRKNERNLLELWIKFVEKREKKDLNQSDEIDVL